MKQVIKFLSVGVLCTILGYAVIFSAMYIFNLSPIKSNLIGYACGLLFSYFLNRTYTFESKQQKVKEFSFFLVVFITSYISNLAVLHFLTTDGVNPGLSQILAGIVYVVISFFLNKYIVFKNGYKSTS